MAENAAPNEGFKSSPDLSETQRADQEKLLKLKEGVEQRQFDQVVDYLMGKAIEKKDVTEAELDAFVTSLDAKQRTDLDTFLSGKPADERATKLRSKLQGVKTE